MVTGSRSGHILWNKGVCYVKMPMSPILMKFCMVIEEVMLSKSAAGCNPVRSVVEELHFVMYQSPIWAT